MASAKENQNTFLIVAGILIVCTIALVAVFNIIWQIIGSPLINLVNRVSTDIRVRQPLNYNFQVPLIENSTNNQSPKPSTGPSYNFQVSLNKEYSTILAYQGVTDKTLEGISFEPDLYKTIASEDIYIEIPKLKINSRILQGINGEELLQQGFWAYPLSNIISKGEFAVFCHRRFWGPQSPNSCWYLDRLVKDDEIFIKNGWNTYKYKVVGVTTYEFNSNLILELSSNKDFIRIITNAPISSNLERLVVLAERVD